MRREKGENGIGTQQSFPSQKAQRYRCGISPIVQIPYKSFLLRRINLVKVKVVWYLSPWSRSLLYRFIYGTFPRFQPLSIMTLMSLKWWTQIALIDKMRKICLRSLCKTRAITELVIDSSQIMEKGREILKITLVW